MYKRQVFKRVVYGTRISLFIGVIVSGIALIVGGILGAIAAYYGGILDEVIMRFMDMLTDVYKRQSGTCARSLLTPQVRRCTSAAIS